MANVAVRLFATHNLSRAHIALRLAVAVAITSTAYLVQLSLWQHLPPSPHLFFYPAVVLTAWWAGTTAGLLSVALSTIALAYKFLPPSDSLAISLAQDALDLAIF